MKIIVLNGSPKGDESVTMQYVNLIIKKNPEVEFNIVNITQRIKRIETDAHVFAEIIEQVRSCDGVVWAFPLYILLVHGGYKRFIELIFERGVQDAFAGKYAAAISTSIHYFDHTAHNYIHAICDDLGMRFVESYSPEMHDMQIQPSQKQLLLFGQHFLDAIRSGLYFQRQYPAINPRSFAYAPSLPVHPISTQGKKVVILHESDDPNSNLARMVERVSAVMGGAVTVVNINSVDIKGGCLGCLKCGGSFHCSYEGKDGFIEFYRTTVMTADILVYAGQIKDRFLSSRWKTVFDRAFFNTHTPVLEGKQMAFLVSGAYSQTANIYEVLKGYSEFQRANLVGVVSDEVESSGELDQALDGLASQLVTFANTQYAAPFTFLGVGGEKVFRDDIWGKLRFVFYADHRAYQRNGIYATFPQADWRTVLFNTFITPILQLKRIRRVFDKEVKKQMVKPLKQIVEKA